MCTCVCTDGNVVWEEFESNWFKFELMVALAGHNEGWRMDWGRG